MRIYLDEDSVDHVLVRLLTQAGHDVQSPADAGRSGKPDPVQFLYAIQESRAILTHNHDDFVLLHRLILGARGHHSGLWIVRRDNDSRRDLTVRGIVNAIIKLLGSGQPIPDELYILNHWR